MWQVGSYGIKDGVPIVSKTTKQIETTFGHWKQQSKLELETIFAKETLAIREKNLIRGHPLEEHEISLNMILSVAYRYG